VTGAMVPRGTISKIFFPIGIPPILMGEEATTIKYPSCGLRGWGYPS